MEAAAGSDRSPWEAQAAGAPEGDRPELPVLAALAGGFVLAKVLGMIFGDDR